MIKKNTRVSSKLKSRISDLISERELLSPFAEEELDPNTAKIKSLEGRLYTAEIRIADLEADISDINNKMRN